MTYIITEVVGAFAYLMLAFSYFKKKKKNILFTQIIALVLFSVHYYLLGGLTGTICNVLELVALIVIYLFDKFKLKNKKLLIIGMIPIFIAIALLNYQDIFSIFPIIAVVITVSSFLTNKEETIRGIGIVSTVCWLVYAVALHSLVSTLFEVLTLVSVLVAFARNMKKDND